MSLAIAILHENLLDILKERLIGRIAVYIEYPYIQFEIIDVTIHGTIKGGIYTFVRGKDTVWLGEKVILLINNKGEE